MKNLTNLWSINCILPELLVVVYLALLTALADIVLFYICFPKKFYVQVQVSKIANFFEYPIYRSYLFFKNEKIKLHEGNDQIVVYDLYVK